MSNVKLICNTRCCSHVYVIQHTARIQVACNVISSFSQNNVVVFVKNHIVIFTTESFHVSNPSSHPNKELCLMMFKVNSTPLISTSEGVLKKLFQHLRSTSINYAHLIGIALPNVRLPPRLLTRFVAKTP